MQIENEGDRLLQGILEDPDSDERRLVYADWLEENGQEERAEFIRVQVELGKGGPDCTYGCPRPDCKRCCLRGRERELLGLYDWRKYISAGWRKFASPAVEVIPTGGHYYDHLRLYRGFVYFVRCTAVSWLTHAGTITSQHPVEEVTLTTLPDAIAHHSWQKGVWYFWHINGSLSKGFCGRKNGHPQLLDILQEEWPRVRKWHLPE